MKHCIKKKKTENTYRQPDIQFLKKVEIWSALLTTSLTGLEARQSSVQP